MTERKNILPRLSTRDLNQEPIRREETGDNVLQYEENAICVEKIKARFDSDFLPRYGCLWRRIIREKEKTEVLLGGDNLADSTSEPITRSLADPRAIDFVEAIERKQTVSISARAHGEECECGCAPPIEEFEELDEEQTKRTVKETLKKGSPTSQSSRSNRRNALEPSHDNPEQHFTTMSDDDATETEEEGDISSIYETAEEFEIENSDLKKIESDTLIGESAFVTTRNDLRNEQENESDHNTFFIGLDVDLDDTEDDESKADRLKNTRTSCVHRSDEANVDDEKDSGGGQGSVGKGMCELHISTGEKEANDTIDDMEHHSTLNTSISGALVDTDDEADDEHDTESDEDDDEEEAEWIPDDESFLSYTKSTPEPNKHIDEKKMTEKRRTNETIDLCDSSSYDEAADSDFTVTDDDDNNLVHKKPNKQVVANKKRDPGRSKASFRRNRDQITASAFDEFNRNAFGGKLEKVVVEWSKKLNTTAGLTRLKKLSTDMTPGVPLKRHAIIELSTKVVDDEEKLRTTLLHELVHAAVWIFEGVSRPPHGADFKRWAKIAMSKVPDVVVTTTHSYHIQYKFNWACINPTCSFVIGRHSKSVDTIRHRCGLCRGKLIEVTSDGAPKKRAQPSAYNLFVKQHSKAVRERLAERHPSVNQADVMKELGRLWRNKKAESSICRLEPVA